MHITQNELSTGGHKLSVSRCANAQLQAPNLADLRAGWHPTTSLHISVPAQTFKLTVQPQIPPEIGSNA